MPDQPLFIYQGLSEPVKSAPFAAITINLWDGEDGPVFSRPRFSAPDSETLPKLSVAPAVSPDKWASEPSEMVFSCPRFMPGLSTTSPSPVVPEVSSMDKWTGQDGPVYSRPRFSFPDSETIPRPPTPVGGTRDQYAQDGPVFSQPRFSVPDSEPIPRAPPEPPHVSAWDTGPHAVIFLQPIFVRVEAEALPRLPPPELTSLDKWHCLVQGMVFDTPRFLTVETQELPWPPPPATEVLTMDKWTSQDGPVFSQPWFVRVQTEEIPRPPPVPPIMPDFWQGYRQHISFTLPQFRQVETEPVPGVGKISPALDMWTGQPGTVFSQPRFVRVETEPIPRLPVVEARTIDKWQSRPQAISFTQPEFFPGTGSPSPTIIFGETPQIDKWDGQDGPVLARPKFLVVETEEIPRPPTPSGGTVDKWQSHRSAMVFNRPQFLVTEGEAIPKLAAIVVSPEVVTPDKWLGQPGPVFSTPRWAAFSGSRAAGGFSASYIPDLNQWESIRLQVFSRPRFLVVEAEEIPRVTTIIGGTVDRWQSQRQAVFFDRPRFSPGTTTGSPSILFTKTPQLDNWTGQDGPIFHRRRFLTVETEEIPRPPTPSTGTVDKWHAHLQGMVFAQPRFTVPHGEEIPKLAAVVVSPEERTLDKWTSRDARLVAPQDWAAFAGSRESGVFRVPPIPHLNHWESIRLQVFSRPQFLVVEAEETPRLPTLPAGTLDRWQSSRQTAVFDQPRFMPGYAVSSSTMFILEPTRLDKWDGQDGPIFTQARFIPVETEEIPRPPTPLGGTVDRWQSHRQGQPFNLPRFTVPEGEEIPKLPTPAVPGTLDKWTTSPGPLFTTPQFRMVETEALPRVPPVEVVTLDKWQSHRQAITFTGPQFFPGISAVPRVSVFTETLTLDKWQGHRQATTFNPRLFVHGESSGSPLPVVPEITTPISKWDGQDGPVFNQPRFSGPSTPPVPTSIPLTDQWIGLPGVIYTRPRFIPHGPSIIPYIPTPPPSVTWDVDPPMVFTRAKFMVGATQAPVAPVVAEPIRIDKWQAPRTTEPFIRQRFMPGATTSSPVPIVPEPTRLDKWRGQDGPVFNQPQFMPGGTAAALSTILLEAVPADQWPLFTMGARPLAFTRFIVGTTVPPTSDVSAPPGPSIPSGPPPLPTGPTTDITMDVVESIDLTMDVHESIDITMVVS